MLSKEIFSLQLRSKQAYRIKYFKFHELVVFREIFTVYLTKLRLFGMINKEEDYTLLRSII